MRQWCNGAQYLFWRNAVAIPMLLLYVFGIPLIAQRLMKQHEKELDAPHIRARYQFLYGARHNIYALSCVYIVLLFSACVVCG